MIASIVTAKPLAGVDILGLIAANSSQLTWVAFFSLMMGISLTAMTVFLYPIFRKDSEELAVGMLLFRGALEGSFYIVATLGLLTLIALSNEYAATGAASAALQSMGNVLYQFQDFSAPVGTIIFVIGATCLYISFYRTRLIPRWLSIWGLIGLVFYMAYALLHFFHMDSGIGDYLQMVLFPQELSDGSLAGDQGLQPGCSQEIGCGGLASSNFLIFLTSVSSEIKTEQGLSQLAAPVLAQTQLHLWIDPQS